MVSRRTSCWCYAGSVKTRGTKSHLETKQRQRPFHMVDTLGKTSSRDYRVAGSERGYVGKVHYARKGRDGVALNPLGMVSEFTGPLEK